MKYRYFTWYWGKYIARSGSGWIDESGKTFPNSQVNLESPNWEEYVEETHGKHKEQS